ncbi:MAG: TonB family protein [Proteobacteria bacterium]|nr:TonB family protein [Pseudomonadota bacterium]
MTLTLHHPHVPEPNLQRIIVASFIVHVAALIILSLTLSNSIRVSPAPAMQVKLIGVPQPPAPSKQVTPEKIRTQASAAPKEPPPDMKNIPESTAKTKFLDAQQKPPEDKPNPIEAQKRPPVLDKTPDKKKVVKNDLDAKVVKNPEDFLKALDFVDDLAKKQATPTPAKVPATQADAGEGPQLQLNLADQGAVDAIRQKVNSNWTFTPGADTRGLQVSVIITVDEQGHLTSLRISQSSGQPAFDASLDRAIRKSDPLPIPTGQYDKFKELELIFAPPPQR